MIHTRLTEGVEENKTKKKSIINSIFIVMSDACIEFYCIYCIPWQHIYRTSMIVEPSNLESLLHRLLNVQYNFNLTHVRNWKHFKCTDEFSTTNRDIINQNTGMSIVISAFVIENYENYFIIECAILLKMMQRQTHRCRQQLTDHSLSIDGNLIFIQ